VGIAEFVTKFLPFLHIIDITKNLSNSIRFNQELKMFSFHKKLFTFFAVLQLIALQVSAETTSHIVYTSAWTGNGIAKGLNNELNFAQEQAYNESKFFELLEISITPQWGYAYILYNLSDRMGETNSLITRVAYVSAWTGGGIADKLKDKINSLQNFAFNENELINIVDIKITPEWGYGYIIYEISD
jgi:hypothetical protein